MEHRRIVPLAEQRISLDAAGHAARTPAVLVVVGDDLHPDSKQLVQLFAEAMARKLRAAEEKYGYRDGWLTQEWEAECRQHMREHMEKGDPVDVGVYAAFMWARNWSTAEPNE